MGQGGGEEESSARGGLVSRLADLGAARWVLVATLVAAVAAAAAWAIGQQQQQEKDQ